MNREEATHTMYGVNKDNEDPLSADMLPFAVQPASHSERDMEILSSATNREV